MIGRALERDVQSKFEIQIGASREQGMKIRKRAELRMNGGMTAGLITDGPWASHIFGLRRWGIVLTFPELMPDGMDRRQIYDVETHAGDVGQARLAVVESAVPPWFGGSRPGK